MQYEAESLSEDFEDTFVTTGDFTTVEPETDPFEEIKNKLPWLQDILSENGTLTVSSGENSCRMQV